MATESTNKPLIFILIFLGVLCVASFIAGVNLNSAAAFALSSLALLAFVAIFAVGVLDYKVGGNQLTLEKRVGTLEKENTELKESVTALLKTIYFVNSPEMPIDGLSAKHHAIIEQYLKPVKHLITEDVEALVNNDIKKAREN